MRFDVLRLAAMIISRIGALRLVSLLLATLALATTVNIEHSSLKVMHQMRDTLKLQDRAIDRQSKLIQYQSMVINLQKERLQHCSRLHREEVKFK
jgi:hypothetical protein